MYQLKDKKKILPLLEENIIAHLNTLGRIKHSKDIEIYVDNLEKPKGFVLKNDYWAIPYSKDEEILTHILQTYPFPDHIGFCGLAEDLSNKIIEKLTDYEVEWDEHCYLYYLPEENKGKLQIEETLPSLRPEDVDIVNNYYTYKEEGSKEYLLDCIIHRPSSVIYDDAGNPISWALVREDNSMGVMYTLEEYRKKGLARKITLDLSKKVLNKGDTPYVHIVDTNIASQNLAREMGYQLWGKVIWFGLRKK